MLHRCATAPTEARFTFKKQVWEGYHFIFAFWFITPLKICLASQFFSPNLYCKQKASQDFRVKLAVFLDFKSTLMGLFEFKGYQWHVLGLVLTNVWYMTPTLLHFIFSELWYSSVEFLFIHASVEWSEWSPHWNLFFRSGFWFLVISHFSKAFFFFQHHPPFLGNVFWIGSSECI